MNRKERMAELVAEMHLLFGEDLIGLLRNNTASSADRSVIRQFLKDNHADAPPADPHMAALAAAARHLDDDDINAVRTH